MEHFRYRFRLYAIRPPGRLEWRDMNEKGFADWIHQHVVNGKASSWVDLPHPGGGQGFGLKSLPHEIGLLTSLERLYLCGHELTSLPAEIGRLRKLEQLSLGLNKLTALPAEIGHLRKLKIIHVYENRLTELPPEIGELSNLGQLNAAANELTALPSEIGKLRSLEILNLRHNQLTKLPPEIGKLRNLKRLYIQGNPLPVLPPELAELSALTELHIDAHLVRTAPPVLKRLSGIESVVLYGKSSPVWALLWSIWPFLPFGAAQLSQRYGLIEDEAVFLAIQRRFIGFVLFQPIEVFEKQQPGSLFRIIQLRRAAGLFPQHVVDVFEGLLEHEFGSRLRTLARWIRGQRPSIPRAAVFHWPQDQERTLSPINLLLSFPKLWRTAAVGCVWLFCVCIPHRRRVGNGRSDFR